MSLECLSIHTVRLRVVSIHTFFSFNFSIIVVYSIIFKVFCLHSAQQRKCLFLYELSTKVSGKRDKEIIYLSSFLSIYEYRLVPIYAQYIYNSPFKFLSHIIYRYKFIYPYLSISICIYLYLSLTICLSLTSASKPLSLYRKYL